jgi:hypothetical protein
MTNTQPLTRMNNLAWPAVLIFTALTYVFLYTFTHEGGHALVGTAFGQKLTAFQVNIFTLNAYVSMQGYLTPSQQALKSAAGHGLPLLLWAVFMLLAPRRGDVVLRLLKAVSSASILASTSVWAIIPLLYLQGQAPPGDDVTSFLNTSAIPPLLLTGISVVVMVLMALLAWKKNQDLLKDLRHFIELRRQGLLNDRMAQSLPRSRKTLIILGSLGTISALLLTGMQAVLPGQASTGSAPMPIPRVTSLRLCSTYLRRTARARSWRSSTRNRTNWQGYTCEFTTSIRRCSS